MLVDRGAPPSAARASPAATPGACSGKGSGDDEPDRAGAGAAGQLERRARGDHPAAVDDVDLVGEPLGLLQVVRGQHRRHPVAAQLLEQRPGVAARLRVHPGGRLVDEEQLRPPDHGHREGEPLLLAAGEPPVRRAPAVAEAEPLDEHRDRQRVRVQRGDVVEHLLGPGTRSRRRRTGASRRCGGAAPAGPRCGSSPRTRTVPCWGRRNPSQVSSVVVLPAPLGPRTAVIEPRATVRSRPSTATLSPYAIRSPRTSTAGDGQGRSDTPSSLGAGAPRRRADRRDGATRHSAGKGEPYLKQCEALTTQWCCGNRGDDACGAVEAGADAPTRSASPGRSSSSGPSTAAALAERLDLTPAAVRRHLDHMLDERHRRGPRPAGPRQPRPRPPGQGVRADRGRPRPVRAAVRRPGRPGPPVPRRAPAGRRPSPRSPGSGSSGSSSGSTPSRPPTPS